MLLVSWNIAGARGLQTRTIDAITARLLRRPDHHVDSKLHQFPRIKTLGRHQPEPKPFLCSRALATTLPSRQGPRKTHATSGVICRNFSRCAVQSSAATTALSRCSACPGPHPRTAAPPGCRGPATSGPRSGPAGSQRSPIRSRTPSAAARSTALASPPRPRAPRNLTQPHGVARAEHLRSSSKGPANFLPAPSSPPTSLLAWEMTGASQARLLRAVASFEGPAFTQPDRALHTLPRSPPWPASPRSRKPSGTSSGSRPAVAGPHARPPTGSTRSTTSRSPTPPSPSCSSASVTRRRSSAKSSAPRRLRLAAPPARPFVSASLLPLTSTSPPSMTRASVCTASLASSTAGCATTTSTTRSATSGRKKLSARPSRCA